MKDWERFLKNLPKVRLEERVQIFRHEALRSLHMAKAYAALLQKEIEGCPELPEETRQWPHKLLDHLVEMQQLFDALTNE